MNFDLFRGMALRWGGEEHEWQQQPYDCRHLVCLVSSGGLHAFVCSEFETEKPGDQLELQEVEGVNTTRSSVAATVGPDAKGHAAVVRATHLPLRCAGRVL